MRCYRSTAPETSSKKETINRPANGTPTKKVPKQTPSCQDPNTINTVVLYVVLLLISIRIYSYNIAISSRRTPLVNIHISGKRALDNAAAIDSVIRERGHTACPYCRPVLDPHVVVFHTPARLLEGSFEVVRRGHDHHVTVRYS